MATIAEFTIPAASFPLGRICHASPGAEVELERVIPTGEAVVPYFWVRGLEESEEEQLEAAFDDDPDVKQIRRIDEVSGNYLNRVEWVPEYEGIIRAITETNVVLLSGVGTAGVWTMQLNRSRSVGRESSESHQSDLSRPRPEKSPLTVSGLALPDRYRTGFGSVSVGDFERSVYLRNGHR